ncbi:hypothetical protein [Streptomyces sp. MZ04]|uniref:hypothetical protein n=1 Tax=Streptomyces sp. MZ04 TaxID=2559236 RepID=UPI00107EA5CA|nr:hypothetical protein [Streptomyces sp. MZ04]TGA90492.1 hypothetical protein E2651_38590 [Streptomyces sp. MZ04]
MEALAMLVKLEASVGKALKVSMPGSLTHLQDEDGYVESVVETLLEENLDDMGDDGSNARTVEYLHKARKSIVRAHARATGTATAQAPESRSQRRDADVTHVKTSEEDTQITPGGSTLPPTLHLPNYFD